MGDFGISPSNARSVEAPTESAHVDAVLLLLGEPKKRRVSP